MRNVVDDVLILSLDCCMSGCAVCVHDLYLDALKSYRSSLREIRDRLVAKSVPRDRWPRPILELKESAVSSQDDDIPDDVDATARAFMKLERQLKEKHKA